MGAGSARSAGGGVRLVRLAVWVAVGGVLAVSGAAAAWASGGVPSSGGVAVERSTGGDAYARGEGGYGDGGVVGAGVSRGAPVLPFRGVVAYGERFTVGGEQRFYTTGWAGMSYLGSEWTVGDWALKYAGEDEGDEYARRSLAGSDGERYGFNIRFGEPACGPLMAMVVSAATGKVVACGWDWSPGPVLVNFDESYRGVEDPVFPVDERLSDDFGECDRDLDIRDLGRAGSQGAGEPA